MKKVVLILLVVLIAGIGIGYYLYNMPVASVADRDPVAIVTADELMESYENNETGSDSLYLDKLVQVEGIIQSIQSDTSGVIILLSTSGGMFGISCKLEPGQIAPRSASEGAKIQLKGIVNGYMGDVSMNRCVPTGK